MMHVVLYWGIVLRQQYPSVLSSVVKQNFVLPEWLIISVLKFHDNILLSKTNYVIDTQQWDVVDL